ncbi:MAG: ABC transporter permease [Acidobacteriota bacterium]|nr:ABC transporter permease [Acidobacteriota bacterium]
MSLRRFFRRGAWDRERAEEIDAHLAHMADDLRARGLSADDARHRARVRFGNPTLVREEIYQMNSIPVLETIARDARYAARMLRRSPGFAATAILTLAVAIGANAAVFSLVDAVLLRPLPYPKPGQLANPELRVVTPRGSGTQNAIDGATWQAFTRHVTSADAAVYSDWRAGVNLSAAGQALNVDQARVSAGYFRVLGVAPALGREFTAEEDREGGPSAVILSHSLWQRALGGNPSVLDTTILLRGEGHRVVGIMPEGFRGTSDVDLWTPVRPSVTGQGGGTNYMALFRVKEGASWPAVEAELAAAHASLGLPKRENVSMTWALVPLQQGLTADTRDTLVAMWAAVGLVLVIACVNLAGLLLARARTRAREIATRMALGSGRRAVIRQLLVESLMLALVGGALGIALGYVLLAGLQELGGDRYATWQNVTLSWRAVGMTAAVSMLAALAFGLLPALHASRLDVQSGLREGSTRGASASSGGWTRRVLVVSEVALGVVLLVGAGLLTRTFLSLQNLNPGFDLGNVVTGSASLEDTRYQTAEQTMQLFDQSLERVKAIPGVESAAISLGLPYERILNLGFRPLDGEAVAGVATGRNFITNLTYVTPGYFETLRMPVKTGRGIIDTDRAGSAPIVVVNEAFQRLYYPEQGVLGRRIGVAGGEREVVGIVGDVQYRQPGWGEGGPIRTTPIMYVAASQTPAPMLNLVHTWFSPTWIVRTSIPVAGMDRALRDAVHAVDPQLPLASVRGMEEVRAEASASQRFMMVLAGLMAAASMLLAAIGIHGLISSSITERTREIGIRMALGSTSAQAIRAVTMPGLALTLVGLVVGVVLARASTQYIASLLWGVEPTDPATYAIVAALLLAVAIVASLLPALRILRLDPATTLRA